MAEPRRKKSPPLKLEDFKVTTEPSSPVPVGDGYALPPVFSIGCVVPHPRLGDLTIGIDVEVDEQRARAKRVSVGTDRPLGVGSPMLHAVPIRDIVATGVRSVLLRVEYAGTPEKPSAKLTPVEQHGRGVSDEVIAVVKRIVGYVDGKGRPKGEGR